VTGIAIRAFRGAVPRTSERLLADNQAQTAVNMKITSGCIEPLKGLGLVHTSLAASIATMYRYRFGDIYNWLVSTKVVDFTRSPVAQDSLGRFYYTGDGEPRMSTYADAISGVGPYPAAWYVLGVTPPVAAIAITVTGGVGADEARAYVYTFVTRYAEESGPSPATLKTGKTDGSWDISGMSVAPSNYGTISAAAANTPLSGQVQVTLDTVFGLAAYEELTFSGVAGMTDLNAKFALVSVNTATNQVVVALTTAQVYAAGADIWTRVAPHNTTSMVKRIYRTVGNNTDYKFVAEIPVANTTYSDTVAATVVSLNNGIPTLDTLPPLKNAHSAVLLANDAMALAAGNQVALSESGKPYSWPLANRYSVPGTVVALVAAGNAVIVLTDNFPYVVTATVPEAASVTKIPGDTLAPCVSKLGVVDIGSGAIFPSHNGLFVATTSGARNITEALYTFDEWKKLHPQTFKAAFADQKYYAMHDSGVTDQAKMFMLHTKEADSILEFSEQVDALYSNPWDGKLYVGKANKISEWDADDNNRYMVFYYTKENQLAKPVNMSVAQVQAQFSEIQPVNNTILAANQALMATGHTDGEIASAEVGVYEIAGSGLLPVPVQTMGSVQYTLVRNGRPVFTKRVTDSKAFRLPAGVKSDLYAVQLSASIRVDSLNMAEGMDELRQAGL
jgi:hypothetical protein